MSTEHLLSHERLARWQKSKNEQSMVKPAIIAFFALSYASLVTSLLTERQQSTSVPEVKRREKIDAHPVPLSEEEKERILMQINLDLDCGLEECRSITNLCGITCTLAKLGMMKDSVSVKDVNEISASHISPQLHSTMVRTLGSLEKHPELIAETLKMAKEKTATLPLMDLRGAPLTAAIHFYETHMAEQKKKEQRSLDDQKLSL